MEEKIHMKLEFLRLEFLTPTKSNPTNFPIYMKLSPNSCSRSSLKHKEPLPLFFTPATTFILLKNPRLQSSERGCWWLLKKNEAVGGAWVLMVAWEEWSKRMTTPMGVVILLLHSSKTWVSKTWVFKTQIFHRTRASKAQDLNFVNRLKKHAY